MNDAVIIWGMVCATILLIVFGVVGIVAWIDRYHITELQRLSLLETQVKQLKERQNTFEMERTTVSGNKPWVTLTKTKHKRVRE